jgi:aerobic-type carbon monoxide dehydrogenase small subunit (CoxS/CutS family)
METDAQKKSGVSRRLFLQGAAGGAVASSALAAVPLVAKAADPPVRTGLKRYAAEGADIVLSVNGKDSPIRITPQTTLLHALRESLDLTGSKEVCDRGACGGCTVHLDGRSVNSCMVLAVDAVGRQVTTVEGLKKGDQLDPVQQAFVDHDACQCGFCIPGFVMRSRALLDETPQMTRDQIKHGLCGNICRCAAYTRIFDAVESVAKGGQG